PAESCRRRPRWRLGPAPRRSDTRRASRHSARRVPRRTRTTLLSRSAEVAVEYRLAAVAASALDGLVTHRAQAIREDLEHVRRGLHVTLVLDVCLDLG